MIVYREITLREHTATKLVRLERLADADAPLAFLVELGELEQALVDAANPRCDGWGPLERRLRAAVLAASAAYLATLAGGAAAPHLARARRALSGIRDGPLPLTISVRPPEGFAFYALDPAGYAAAARTYLELAGPDAGSRAVVIGVRTIGTTLSGIVAAALGSSRTVTVRPRGSSGSRHIASDRRLEARLEPWIREDVDVLIVDEGPGATGETLEAVARWLRHLGVPDRRLVLFPSSDQGMPLASAERRAWFARARKYPPPPSAHERAAGLMAALELTALEDLSFGRWRHRVPGAGRAPVCAIHERVKGCARDARGRLFLLRDAGLGRWGEETARRAVLLAEAGAGPALVGLQDGYLALPWIEGQMVDRRATRGADFLRGLEAYLRARAPLFRTGQPVDREVIARMLLENATEALGTAPPGLAPALKRLERLPEREAVIADARLRMHEWLRTATGYVKVDTLDHGCGIRLPGPTDAAWDLAGAAVEFRLDDTVLEALTARFAAAAGERERELREAVRAYRAPYAALSLGETTLFSREAWTLEDGRRFHTLARGYRTALIRELRRNDR